VILDLKVLKVNNEFKERLVLLELSDLKVLLELIEQLDLKVLKVNNEFKERLVLLELIDFYKHEQHVPHHIGMDHHE
jgi:hypothetical protein